MTVSFEIYRKRFIQLIYHYRGKDIIKFANDRMNIRKVILCSYETENVVEQIQISL